MLQTALLRFVNEIKKSVIRCSCSSCEMHTKIEMKEEDPLSDDIASQNEGEEITMKTNSGAVLLDGDCDVAVKTEIQPETTVTHFCSQKEREHFIKHPLEEIKSETVTCSSNNNYEREFLPEDSKMKVKRYNSDHEMDNKMEIKEEPWWLETETSSVCDDIKDDDFTPVKSPRLSIIRCSNSCEMDTKVEIKEENPLQKEFFTKNVAVKTNSETVLLDNDCDGANKTEFKLETSLPDFCSQKEGECFTEDPINHMKSESVTCSNNCKIDTKTQIDSQKVTELIPEDPVIEVKKYNNDHESDNNIEIKEERWWLETEASSVCDDIKDGDFTPGKSPRLCTEAVSGDSSGDSPFSSSKNTSLCSGKDCPKCGSQGSNVTKIRPAKQHADSEQSGKCSDGREIYSRTSLIHKDESLHKCNVCHNRFTHMKSEKRHNLIHKCKKSHKCEICEKRFSRMADLKRHNLIHEGKKPHKCEICEKRFTRLADLKMHSFIHEGNKPHKCEICEKSFAQLSSLKVHNLIHEGKKPHKCEICDKSFTYLSSLKRHNLIHEGKKTHKCEICEKRIIRLSDMKRHNMIHEGKKPHKCEICKKSFTQLGDLKRHIFTHKGKMPHKCEICEKSFTQLSDLKLHNFIHEGNKPHECEICEQSFTHLSSLKRHTLLHEGKKPHECQICDKSFTQLSHLKLHNVVHEGKKPYKCKICEKSFTHPSSLKRHNLLHKGKKP